MANVQKLPFGNAATTSAMTVTGAQAITVKDSLTLIDGVTASASGNRTLNLTIDDETPVGALLLVLNKTDATETLTHGTSITAPVITGVAGKTTSQLFIYNGTGFYPAGAKIQID